jgi:hypothetical protein
VLTVAAFFGARRCPQSVGFDYSVLH